MAPSAVTSISETTSPSTASTSGDEDGYISEDTLRAMSHRDLLALVQDNSIAAPGSVLGNREDLIEWLLKEFGC